MLVTLTIILLFIAIHFTWKWWVITKELEELKTSLGGNDDEIEWYAV